MRPSGTAQQRDQVRVRLVHLGTWVVGDGAHFGSPNRATTREVVGQLVVSDENLERLSKASATGGRRNEAFDEDQLLGEELVGPDLGRVFTADVPGIEIIGVSDLSPTGPSGLERTIPGEKEEVNVAQGVGRARCERPDENGPEELVHGPYRVGDVLDCGPLAQLREIASQVLFEMDRVPSSRRTVRGISPGSWSPDELEASQIGLRPTDIFEKTL